MPRGGIPDLSAAPLKCFEPPTHPTLLTVTQLFSHAENSTIEAASWYMRRRVSPSRASKVLRAAGAFAAIAGAVVPLIHSVAPTWIQAEWGFVLLALGGGAVLFDRSFGFSASWTRYVRAALALQRALSVAQALWIKTYIAIDPNSPTTADLDALLQIVTKLREETTEILEGEAVAWAGYLTESIEELTRSTVRDPLPPQMRELPYEGSQAFPGNSRPTP